jgi:hypothetical protein
MTDEQQAAAWRDAEARQTKLTSLPDTAKDGMKAGICTSAARAELEQQLATSAFCLRDSLRIRRG